MFKRTKTLKGAGRMLTAAALALALGVGAYAADTTKKAAFGKRKAAPAADLGNRLVSPPEGPFTPTTEQLIDPATLGKDKTGTMMLLHINDVHEILKPPARLGGLAYVAGYANGVRAKRPDTIFLDAGDILEKGDAMSRASKGEASYRVLGAIGLDATVPGNHDFVFGLEKLLANIKLVNLPCICTGMIYNDTKESVLPETMIKQIGSVKVGIIGATIGRTARSVRPTTQFKDPELGRRINELALQLEPKVDLTILVLHNGTWAGKMLAKAAPTVDIVITGHTNEVTEKPLKSETGALVVGVGRAGQWVGTMDLVVDRDQKKVAKYTYVMAPMDHQKIQPDEKVAKLVDEMDKKWTPKDAATGAPASAGGKKGQAARSGKKGKRKGAFAAFGQ